MLNRPKPLVLLILDGFGYSLDTKYNAIAMANTPCWDRMQREYPMTLLNCSGNVVGLPDAQMGSSEVGHLHIGSGRYVPQELSRVSDAINDGSFFANPVLRHAVGGRMLVAADHGNMEQVCDDDSGLAILGVEQAVEMTGKSLVKTA